MNKFPEDSLTTALGEELQRFEALVQAAAPAQQAALREAEEKIRVVLEGLHVVEEELRQQNEEILATRDALDTERHRYRDLFELAPDGYLATDLHGMVREANRAAGELLGLSPERLIGKPLVDFVGRDDERAFRTRLGTAAQARGPRRWEIDLQPRGGEPFRASMTVAVSRGQKGESVGLRWLMRDVTEKKRTGRLLAESERLFRRTFVQAPIGAALVGLDGAILKVNEALCDMLGYREEELLRRSWQEITDPDDLARNQANKELLLKGDLAVYQAEKRCLTRDGRTVWTSTSMRVVREEDGAPLYLLPMMQDVSERKKLDTELRQNWARIAFAEQIAHFGTWERGLADEEVWWSPECYRLFGVDPAHFQPTYGAFLDCVHPDDRAGLVAAGRRAASAGQDLDEEFRLVRPDGTERILHSVGHVVGDGEGDPLKLIGVLHDVTEQRRAEAELRKNERRLRTLADAMPQLVWTGRPDGAIDYCNVRIQEYAPLGRTEDGFFEWRLIIHPEDLGATERAWGTAVRDGTVYQVEHRVKRADGTYRWHLTRAVPMKDEQGRVSKWFGTSTDIDALKEVEAELRRARDAAEAAARAKSEFVANMSHEIRTPLTGILGMTEVLDGTVLDPEQRECVDAIRLSGKLLLGIVNDILDLSKIEAVGVRLESLEFALQAVIEDTVHLQAEMAHVKGLELCCRVDPGVPAQVVGDPGRLRQVIFNLVGNAIKFTERGQVVVRAEATRAGETATVRVEVTDSGIGIPASVQGRLFQTFTQGDASSTRRYGGSGLGLAISKRLVEAMGGEIGLRSVPGEGSTFWFTVPFPVVAGRQDASEAISLAGTRALVVMPHAVSRELVVEQLARLGAAAEGAADRAEALQRAGWAGAENEPFGLALLDLDLPEVSGLALARELVGRAPGPGPGIILLAPFTSRGLAVKASEEDGYCFLLKPVRERDLAHCAAAVLANEPLPAAAQNRPYATVSPPTSRGTVLLAEDNPVVQLVMGRFLERLGCRVDVVEDGALAVERALEKSYTLVLMDWQMPGMDGLEAARAIRRREDPDRRVPIVALTAHALAEHRAQCLAAGMDDYLSKPVALEDLARVLEKWTTGAEEEPSADGAPGGFGRVADRLSEFEERLGREGTWRIVALFLEQGPERLAALRAATERGDAVAVVREAHQFRGTCCHLGTERILEAAGGLERRAEAGDLKGAEAQLDTLAAEWEGLRTFLEARRSDDGG